MQVAAPDAAKAPTEQAVQPVDPERDVEPAAHTVQEATPATVENVPAAQLTHVCPTAYWPAIQLVQLTGPPVSVHVLDTAARAQACVVPVEPAAQYHV